MGVDPDRLERSCRRRPDSIRFGVGTLGLERAEVYLSSAFEPHRHDTYAIGITTAGVQTFRYRGSRRICLPGQLHILHPDETHDGAAGTEDGFGCRILYLAPDAERAVVPNAAHMMQFQNSAGLNQAILGFLARHDTDGAALAE